MSMIPAVPPAPSAISKREHDVLVALARGMIEKEVAASLGIGIASVRVYRKRLQIKLGTRGLVQSMFVAWKLGLLDIEPIAQEAMEQRRMTVEDENHEPERER